MFRTNLIRDSIQSIWQRMTEIQQNRQNIVLDHDTKMLHHNQQKQEILDMQKFIDDNVYKTGPNKRRHIRMNTTQLCLLLQSHIK